jgi:hypothetical protein
MIIVGLNDPFLRNFTDIVPFFRRCVFVDMFSISTSFAFVQLAQLTQSNNQCKQGTSKARSSMENNLTGKRGGGGTLIG